jgi:hypothetical protein
MGKVLLVLLAGTAMLAAANEEQQIRDAERALGEAILKADGAALGPMLAPELAYTHTDASTDTREQYLASLADGSMKYESIEQSGFVIRVYGTAAVSRSVLAMKVHRNGRTASFRAQAIRVWVKDGGAWRLVAHQTTRFAA